MSVAYFILAAVAAPAADMLPKEDGRLVMRDFARCMANRHARDAKALVSLDPIVAPLDAPLSLLHSDCMPALRPDSVPTVVGARTPSIALQGSVAHYRYALAEALLLRAYKRSEPVIPSNLPPLSNPALARGTPMPARWTGGAPAWAAYVASSQHDAMVSAAGECVARSSPDQAWYLLKTEIGSKAEADAFAALVPALARCVPKGQNLQLGKFNVRGSIALNFYRLTEGETPASRVREPAQ